MKTRAHFTPAKIDGFTLLEMVITMVIFLLLAGAVFGIITGVLQSVSTLHENQNRRDEIAALNAFFKKELDDLSAQSSLASYKRNSEGLVQNGIILGEAGEAKGIDFKIQANGYYTLRETTVTSIHDSHPNEESATFTASLKSHVTKDDGSLNWTPLIRDIKTATWKFHDPNTDLWLDQWDNAGAKPNLVELSLQLAGDLQPVTMDFWIPQLSPAILPNLSQNASPVSAPTPSHAP
jgi:prepilin-type N-terminal cleavage/methylation domain-containing protein